LNPEPRSVKDTWEIGEAYDSFIGRWSLPVAREFVQWLGVSPRCKWLDVGCGTGALSRTIVDLSDPAEVHGIDSAQGLISFEQERTHDRRVTFAVGDAESLQAQMGAYNVVVSALMLNFVSHPDTVVSEMRRVVKPGGVIAFYVWDYAKRMQLLRYFWDAAVSLNPAASALDEGKRFPLCNPDRLNDLLVAQGLNNIDVRAIEVQTKFIDFEDYWKPFLAGQGPAPSYTASLTSKQQDELRERLRATLPIAADGTISLVARAWAVKGNS